LTEGILASIHDLLAKVGLIRARQANTCFTGGPHWCYSTVMAHTYPSLCHPRVLLYHVREPSGCPQCVRSRASYKYFDRLSWTNFLDLSNKHLPRLPHLPHLPRLLQLVYPAGWLSRPVTRSALSPALNRVCQRSVSFHLCHVRYPVPHTPF
jgi:hypothetical protein